MGQGSFKNTIIGLKRVFKTEDSRFIISVGLKVSAISFAITFFIYYYLLQIMRLNYAFFKAHGLPDLIDQRLFFEFIIGEAIDSLPILFGFHVVLFFIGTYLGWLMLRPFRQIAEYSERVMENQNAVYKIDDFSAHRLLTRFSEFFFEYLREIRKKGEITSNSIPPQYSKIHKPVFDKVFMLHFGLLLIMISIFSSVFIIGNTASVFSSMVELATQSLSDHKVTSRYFSEQRFVLDDIGVVTVVCIVLSYIMLGFHLFTKVSGAAFGIFSTMRSFMKGNYSSRVHLVGFAYLRDYTRKLNKYLDYIQNNFTKTDSKD